MKKITYFISILVFLTFSHGCTTEVDDVFDTTATTRLNEALTTCKNALLSSPNGWVVQYYPESMQSYGGIVVLVDFDESGEVIVASEIADSDHRVTSHYSMLTSNSAVLSFDTYNEIFHFFSDPDVGNGRSYEGDFEFTYVSNTTDEIIFTGTKTGNTYVFKALDANTDWTAYLDGVAQMRETITISPYCSFIWNKGAANEMEFDLDDAYNILNYVPDNTNPDVNKSVAFCYTPTGISLYEPVEVGGSTIKELTWNETKFESGEGASIELTGVPVDNYIPYETFLGDWIFAYMYGTESANVVIERVEKAPLAIPTGVSFVMKGLYFDVEVGYSKRTGKLSITTQYLGRYENYYIYLCPWDLSVGTLGWGSGTGFNLIYNGDAENPELVFADNGRWVGYEATGILFYAFNPPGPPNTAGSLVQYPFVVNLHK